MNKYWTYSCFADLEGQPQPVFYGLRDIQSGTHEHFEYFKSSQEKPTSLWSYKPVFRSDDVMDGRKYTSALIGARI